MAQFQDWLSTTASFKQHTLATCDHEDIISYLAGHWSRQRKSVGPGALTRVVSYMRVWFDTHNRLGPYQPHSNLGNPTCHPLVKQMCVGQKKQAAPQGHQPYCAVPMSWAKLEYVLQQMMVWASTSSPPLKPQQCLALSRDACMFLFCWEGAMRGINGSPNVTLSHFLTTKLSHGYHLCLRAAGVKAYQGKRAPALLFAYEPSSSNFVARLQQYMLTLHASGYDCEQGVLFPSMHGPPSAWAPLAETRLRLLIRKHLTHAGCFQGETCHSFRRGSLQFAKNSLGAGASTLSALSQIKTPHVLQRYISPNRPLYPSRVVV
jgi:hypothetical protein